MTGVKAIAGEAGALVRAEASKLKTWVADEPSKPYRSDGVRRSLLVGLTVAGVLVLGGGLWAGTMSLAGAVIAPGTVVVDSNVKKIQHATGGTIGEILVKDGDRIEQAALLVRLDETVVRANLQIVTKQLDEIAVRKTRLIAEQEGAEALSFPSDIVRRRARPEVAALIDAEQKLFISRRDSRLGQKAQLRQRIGQLHQQIDGLAAQQWAKGREIDLVGKQLDGAEELWSRKLMPITKLTALQREAARLEGERAQLRAQQAQSGGRIAEIELQVLQLDQDLRTEVMKDLSEATAKEAELVERRVAAEDQLRHLDIRAPQAGFVHDLTVHTIGGVIGPGEVLMMIVPEHDALVVEAKIAPQEIDHIHAGQEAFVRFTAFARRTTPEFEGKVMWVAADLTKEEKTGQAYYVARVWLEARGGGEGTAQNGAAPGEARITADKLAGFTLLPGMPAEVHIRTGERTAWSYFLKPLTDQVARAFAEP